MNDTKLHDDHGSAEAIGADELPACELCGRDWRSAERDEVFFRLNDEHGLVVCKRCVDAVECK